MPQFTTALTAETCTDVSNVIFLIFKHREDLFLGTVAEAPTTGEKSIHTFGLDSSLAVSMSTLCPSFSLNGTNGTYC